MGIKMLFINTLKTFRKKWGQLLAIGIIIFLSSFLYTTMSYTLGSLKEGHQLLTADRNLENFSLTLYNGIYPSEQGYVLSHGGSNYLAYSLTAIKKADHKLYEALLLKRQQAFLKHYPNTFLETREYKDVTFDYNTSGHKLRIFKDSETLNRTYIEKGKLPDKADEIALCRIYAEKNHLQLGDLFTIKDKTYTVCGYILLPDYTLPQFDGEFIFDSSKISLAVMSKRGYEQLKGDEGFYFSGIQTSPSPISFKEAVIDTYKDHENLGFILGITEAVNEMRSGAIYDELRTVQATSIGLSLVIATIAVMIVAILTYKILKNEKVQIGVLKALGYSKYEIALPYFLLLLFVALPMLLLGYLMGQLAAAPLKTFYLEYYLLPNSPIIPHLNTLLVSVIVPLSFIMLLSLYIILKQLSVSTISLLKVTEKEKMTYLNKLAVKLLSKASAQKKYKYSFIFKNTGKFLVFFFGISLSSLLILLSLMMMGFFDKMTVDYYNSTAYQYEGHLDLTKNKPLLAKSDEKFLTLDTAFYHQDSISIKGLAPTNKLHKLYTSKGKEITSYLEKGIIVNKSFQITYDIALGDIVEVEYEDKKYSAVVVAFSKDYGDPMIYWNLEDLSLIVTSQKTSRFYTGIYSLEPLAEKDYAVVISKTSVINQTKLMQGFIQLSLYAMIISSIGISVIVLYVLTTLTIEDNYYSVSLLKVMGYSEGEVNDMVLNSYLIYALLTYCLSVVPTILGKDLLVKYYSDSFDMVIPLEYQSWHGLFGLVLIIIIFQLGSYAAKRKIKRISLQEVLKAYQE